MKFSKIRTLLSITLIFMFIGLSYAENEDKSYFRITKAERIPLPYSNDIVTYLIEGKGVNKFSIKLIQVSSNITIKELIFDEGICSDEFTGKLTVFVQTGEPFGLTSTMIDIQAECPDFGIPLTQGDYVISKYARGARSNLDAKQKDLPRDSQTFIFRINVGPEQFDPKEQYKVYISWN